MIFHSARSNAFFFSFIDFILSFSFCFFPKKTVQFISVMSLLILIIMALQICQRPMLFSRKKGCAVRGQIIVVLS